MDTVIRILKILKTSQDIAEVQNDRINQLTERVTVLEDKLKELNDNDPR